MTWFSSITTHLGPMPDSLLTSEETTTSTTPDVPVEVVTFEPDEVTVFDVDATTALQHQTSLFAERDRIETAGTVSAESLEELLNELEALCALFPECPLSEAGAIVLSTIVARGRSELESGADIEILRAQLELELQLWFETEQLYALENGLLAEGVPTRLMRELQAALGNEESMEAHRAMLESIAAYAEASEPYIHTAATYSDQLSGLDPESDVISAVREAHPFLYEALTDNPSVSADERFRFNYIASESRGLLQQVVRVNQPLSYQDLDRIDELTRQLSIPHVGENYVALAYLENVLDIHETKRRREDWDDMHEDVTLTALVRAQIDVISNYQESENEAEVLIASLNIIELYGIGNSQRRRELTMLRNQLQLALVEEDPEVLAELEVQTSAWLVHYAQDVYRPADWRERQSNGQWREPINCAIDFLAEQYADEMSVQDVALFASIVALEPHRAGSSEITQLQRDCSVALGSAGEIDFSSLATPYNEFVHQSMIETLDSIYGREAMLAGLPPQDTSHGDHAYAMAAYFDRPVGEAFEQFLSADPNDFEAMTAEFNRILRMASIVDRMNTLWDVREIVGQYHNVNLIDWDEIFLEDESLAYLRAFGEECYSRLNHLDSALNDLADARTPEEIEAAFLEADHDIAVMADRFGSEEVFFQDLLGNGDPDDDYYDGMVNQILEMNEGRDAMVRLIETTAMVVVTFGVGAVASRVGTSLGRYWVTFHETAQVTQTATAMTRLRAILGTTRGLNATGGLSIGGYAYNAFQMGTLFESSAIVIDSLAHGERRIDLERTGGQHALSFGFGYVQSIGLFGALDLVGRPFMMWADDLARMGFSADTFWLRRLYNGAEFGVRTMNVLADVGAAVTENIVLDSTLGQLRPLWGDEAYSFLEILEQNLSGEGLWNHFMTVGLIRAGGLMNSGSLVRRPRQENVVPELTPIIEFDHWLEMTTLPDFNLAEAGPGQQAMTCLVPLAGVLATVFDGGLSMAMAIFGSDDGSGIYYGYEDADPMSDRNQRENRHAREIARRAQRILRDEYGIDISADVLRTEYYHADNGGVAGEFKTGQNGRRNHGDLGNIEAQVQALVDAALPVHRNSPSLGAVVDQLIDRHDSVSLSMLPDWSRQRFIEQERSRLTDEISGLLVEAEVNSYDLLSPDVRTEFERRWAERVTDYLSRSDVWLIISDSPQGRYEFALTRLFQDQWSSSELASVLGEGFTREILGIQPEADFYIDRYAAEPLGPGQYRLLAFRANEQIGSFMYQVEADGGVRIIGASTVDGHQQNGVFSSLFQIATANAPYIITKVANPETDAALREAMAEGHSLEEAFLATPLGKARTRSGFNQHEITFVDRGNGIFHVTSTRMDQARPIPIEADGSILEGIRYEIDDGEMWVQATEGTLTINGRERTDGQDYSLMEGDTILIGDTYYARILGELRPVQLAPDDAPRLYPTQHENFYTGDLRDNGDGNQTKIALPTALNFEQNALAWIQFNGMEGFTPALIGRVRPDALIISRVPGESLDRLTVEERAEIPTEAWDRFADNLSQLHDIGVFHNDVSPANVVWDGVELRLIDFGESRTRRDLLDEASRIMAADDLRRAEEMQAAIEAGGTGYHIHPTRGDEAKTAMSLHDAVDIPVEPISMQEPEVTPVIAMDAVAIRPVEAATEVTVVEGKGVRNEEALVDDNNFWVSELSRVETYANHIISRYQHAPERYVELRQPIEQLANLMSEFMRVRDVDDEASTPETRESLESYYLRELLPVFNVIWTPEFRAREEARRNEANERDAQLLNLNLTLGGLMLASRDNNGQAALTYHIDSEASTVQLQLTTESGSVPYIFSFEGTGSEPTMPDLIARQELELQLDLARHLVELGFGVERLTEVFGTDGIQALYDTGILLPRTGTMD